MDKKGFAVIELALVLIIIILLALIPISCVNRTKIGAKIMNNKYNTNYTFWEYFWGENLIKDYIHTGEQKTFNLNLENKVNE